MDNYKEQKVEHEHNDAAIGTEYVTDENVTVETIAATSESHLEVNAQQNSQPFELTYDGDGVHFETSEVVGRNEDDILLHIKRKNLQQVDMNAVDNAIKKPGERVCIAPPQQEIIYDEQALITITSDQTEAYICLLPPDKEGERLTYQQIIVDAAAKSISYGIDEKIIKDILDNQIYGENVCFARAKLPEDGEDGELVFHFNTELLGKPAIDDQTGKVDYMNLNLFVQVTEGDKLVSRVPATPGRPGTAVTGRVLNQKSGKEAKLPSGKNVTYNEDRSAMFAGLTGRVDYRNNTVAVSSCYTVQEDADLTTGNITFDGDVIVKGNVISTITIQATKNIEVYGVVEGATLIAGGSILLRNGMVGNDKGFIQAEGNVTAKYIERSKVVAGGDIMVDAMLHCMVESGGSIVAKGKHGSIIGGTIKAQNSITAQSIGSVVNVRTNIEVGISPAKTARMKFLSADIERLGVEIEKFDKIISYLSRMENLPPDKEQMKRTVTIEKIRDTKLLSEHTTEIAKLEEDFKSSEMGKVHVTDTIYQGVKLTISLGEFVVTDALKYATFYCKNRKISYTSCQI